MKNFLIYFFLFAIVAGSFVLSIAMYSYLPDPMVTRWSMVSEPNGYSPKLIGAFLVPVVISIVAGFVLVVFNYIVTLCQCRPIRILIPVFLLSILGFLLFTHLIVLLSNLGWDIDVTKLVLTGVGVLVVLESVVLILAINKAACSLNMPESIETVDTEQMDYSDKLVKISADEIVFYNYYFPFGNKSVKLDDIDCINVLKGGCLRLHGSDDLRTWYPADYNRMSRDRRFIVHLKNKWRRIGFTVEDGALVNAILANKELIKSIPEN